MASRSTHSPKPPTGSAQQLAGLFLLTQTCYQVMQKVQRPASSVCKDLADQKLLLPRRCRALLSSLIEIEEPLSRLCAAFAPLATIPESVVVLRFDLFYMLKEMQRQTKDIQKRFQAHYQRIIASETDELFAERQTIHTHLLAFLEQCRCVCRALRELKKILVPETSSVSQEQASPLEEQELIVIEEMPSLVALPFTEQKRQQMDVEEKSPMLFSHGYALLVGVGADLPVTIRDAQAIQHILSDPEHCAYPPGQIRLLTEQQANRGGILAGLDWLIECVQQDAKATVIVYFSGHGGFSPDYHLVPYGYDSRQLAATAISGDEFTQKLRAIEAQKLLLLLDCCHAAGMAVAKGANFRRAPFPPDLPKALAQGEGRVFIASSRGDEASSTGTPYSVFTQALREGFAGYGSATRDGYAYIGDIALHVGRLVPARTNDQQHPVLDMHRADNFPVAYYAGGAKTPQPLADTPARLFLLDRTDNYIVQQYRQLLRQEQENLITIEQKMVAFIDQAAIPPDFIRMKQDALKAIEEREREIQKYLQQQGIAPFNEIS